MTFTKYATAAITDLGSRSYHPCFLWPNLTWGEKEQKVSIKNDSFRKESCEKLDDSDLRCCLLSDYRSGRSPHCEHA